MKRTAILWTLVITLFAGSEIWAQGMTLYVGGDKKVGSKLAQAQGGQWVPNFTKALPLMGIFANATNHLEVRISEGKYTCSKQYWKFPRFANSDCVLHIKGGYSRDFSSRKPFHTPTYLIPKGRYSQGLFSFPYSSKSRQSQLKGFILDGVLVDIGVSNNYSGSGVLLKGRSNTTALFAMGYFKTDLLEVRNCVFMNAAHRISESLIRPASRQTKIRYYNTIFYNCVIPIKLDVAMYKGRKPTIEVDHCSFILNWPYNPDPTTGNPACLEVGHPRVAQKVLITNNLFYANPGGGVFFHGRTGPHTELKNNNFVCNGLLYGQTGLGNGAFVLYGRGRKAPMKLSKVKVQSRGPIQVLQGNVAIRPGLPIALDQSRPVDPQKVAGEKNWGLALVRLLGGNPNVLQHYGKRKVYDPKRLLFPLVKKAQSYGASPDLVGTTAKSSSKKEGK